MLIKATPEDIAQYGDFAYRLALDPTRSAYPAYSDGIKTRMGFEADAVSAVTKDTSELLLFVSEGTVEGWIQYFWIPQDRYLQLSACNIRCGTARALAELLELLRERFPGYTMYFGFPGENTEAIRFLREHGFQSIEEDWNQSFFFDNYDPHPADAGVIRITRENFEDFRTVYHPEPETYWDCDRILETMDDWIIFGFYKNGVPAAAVFLQGEDGYYEIYGLEFADGIFAEDIFRALLTAALNACKGMGAKYMTYFCGEKARRILPELGFRCVGRYVLHIKTLDEG